MTAGQLGESGGGFQRSVGESQAMGNALQWRLNVRGPSFPSPSRHYPFQWLTQVTGSL